MINQLSKKCIYVYRNCPLKFDDNSCDDIKLYNAISKTYVLLPKTANITHPKLPSLTYNDIFLILLTQILQIISRYNVFFCVRPSDKPDGLTTTRGV